MPRTAHQRKKVFITRAIDPAALTRLRAAAEVSLWDEEIRRPLPRSDPRSRTSTRYSRWLPTRSTRA